MQEQEPHKEIIHRGELFFLHNPGTDRIFSGYGLTQRKNAKEFLVGLLMVDRPRPADPTWLKDIEETFGEYQLIPMTASGERGIVCQMQIEPESIPLLKQYPGQLPVALKGALLPLLNSPPKPTLRLSWDESLRLWHSELATAGTLPDEIREVFEQFGYGCLTAETNIGIVHICHAATSDVEGFENKSIWYEWQLIKMPTAPLIRMEIAVIDDPDNPYRFETFFNIEDDAQADILAGLTNQRKLYFAFYGDDLSHSHTTSLPHDEQHWQYLDELVEEAIAYWNSLPTNERNFDLAKEQFINQYP